VGAELKTHHLGKTGDAMTNRKINQNRKLSFQQLENRQLMAANITAGLGSHLTSSVAPANLPGNVTAAVANHGLTITGDSGEDLIRIVQVAGSTNQFTVIGYGGTTVNNQSSQTFTVTGSISVLFLNGTGNMIVGGPSQAFPYTTLPGSLNVVYGKAGVRDEIDIINATVRGNLSVASQTGITVYTNDAVVGVPSVNGGNNDFRLNLQGANTIELNYTTVERDLLINAGVNGPNNIFLSGGHVGRNATIQTGIANDNVSVDEYYFGGQLNIQTGGGNDTVVLGEHVDPSGNQPRNKSAEYSVHADSIFTDLGDGDDQLFVNNLYGATNFIGGTGTDTMFHDDGIKTGSYVGTSGFESIDGVAPGHAQHVAVKAKKN
jgi:hypothetical protein